MIDAEDAEWYRTEYRRLGEEITALKALPERKPGMRTGAYGPHHSPGVGRGR